MSHIICVTISKIVLRRARYHQHHADGTHYESIVTHALEMWTSCGKSCGTIAYPEIAEIVPNSTIHVELIQ